MSTPLTPEDAAFEDVIDDDPVYYSRSGFESSDLDDTAYEIGKYIDGTWDRVAVAQTETLAEMIVSLLNRE